VNVEGKLIDVQGIHGTTKAGKIGLVDHKSEIKKAKKVNEDGELPYQYLVVPQPLYNLFKELRNKVDVEGGAKISGDKMSHTRAKAIMAGINTTVDKLGCVGPDSDDDDDDNSKKKDDKLDKVLAMMASSMQSQEKERTALLEALMNKESNKEGKKRSPNGRMRKKGKGTAASSSATGGSGGAGTGSISPAVTFGSESSEEDDDDESDFGAAGAVNDETVRKNALIGALKIELAKHWEKPDIIWENKKTENKFDEMSPLAGVQELCYVNLTLAVKRVNVKALTNYLMLYPEVVLNQAVTKMRGMVEFWRKYQQPGRKIDLLVKTYGVELFGTAKPERKSMCVLAGVLIVNKEIGNPPMDPELMEF